MKNHSLNWMLAVALGFAAAACESASEGGGGTGAAPEPMGYVVSDFGFLHPEGDPSDFGMEGVRGFDLDSTVSSSDTPPCAHDDFVAPDGTPGIDYGLWSFLRQFEPLQKDQLIDSVIASAVKNGEMSIVMELAGVDDMVNDDAVTVQIFSTQDSPLVGTDGEVLPNATLALHPDPLYHSTIATGAIKDGVLEAGPFDVSLKFFIQIVDSDMLLTDSWIRLDLGNGSPSGVLASHWSVAQIDEIIGTPTSANGEAAGFDHTEFLAAMEAADAGYDEASGECTAFTTIFRLEAVPAFLTN